MTHLEDGKERPRIYDREGLQQWLDAQPPDRRRETAVVVSARAALRALPMIVLGKTKPRPRQFEQMALAVFSAMAFAWTAQKHSSLPYDYRTTAGATADDVISAAARAAAADALTTSYAARTVARAAARVGSDGYAASDIWRSTSADITSLEGGRSQSELADDALWGPYTPQWARDFWTELRRDLTEAHWRPWREWYQRRLDGVELADAVELVFATPFDPQQQDPAAHNTLLAWKIAQLTPDHELHQTPEVPEPKPAAIESNLVDGKVRLRQELANADLNTRTLNASLRALKRQFGDLVESLDAESNIDKRATASLRRLADLIPTKRPTQEQLFRLAHEQEKLEAYAASVVEEWPRMLAADYLAATRAFDRTVRQFPSWRQFKANAEKDRLTAEQREETPRIAAEFAEALREDEAAQFVEREIAAIVSEMASRLAAQSEAQAQGFDPIAAGADLLAEDLVASIDNVLKTIAEAAISTKNGVAGTAKRAGKSFASHAEKSIVKEAGKLGDGVGPALTKWAKRALIGVPVTGAGYIGVKGGAITLTIQKLMHQFPQIEEWLRPVLDFLS